MSHIYVLQEVNSNRVVSVKGFDGWSSKEEAKAKLEEFQEIVKASGRKYKVKVKSV